MKATFFILLMPALIFSGLVRHKQNGQGQTKSILSDFRIDRTYPPPKIPLTTQRALLSKVFRKYLSDESECNPQFDAGESADRLAAARKAGQIVPSFVDMASGSFTAAGQVQTIYVISVGECNASHAENYGTNRVAIFSGQQLIADLDADFRSSIVRKVDLNNDGVDELLMTGGDMNQGIAVETAALLDFRNGRLRVIEDFGTVSEDSCGSEMPGSTAKASVISIGATVPGQMPKLKMDNYIRSCRSPKRWRFLSTGKMPD